MELDPKNSPFWDHVDQLRQTFLRSLFVILTSTLICFCFYQDLFYWVTKPLQDREPFSWKSEKLIRQEIKRERVSNPHSTPLIFTLKEGSRVYPNSPGIEQIDSTSYRIPPGGSLDIEQLLSSQPLVLFGPIDGISVTFKICFWLGLALSSPLWIYFIIQFLIPALTENEWNLLLPFLGLSFLFLSCGVLFAYFVTIPLANQYLQTFNSTIGINLWSLPNYLDFTLFLILANALAFEISLILLFLVHCRVIDREFLRSKRRIAYLFSFVLGALLTPPDILTQILLAGLLIVLYELTLIYAKSIRSPEHE